MEPPDDFLCPMSHAIMDDPVVAADGHTYERGMIVEWLRREGTSPMTRARMPADVRRNITLKRMIDAWKDESTRPRPDGAPPPSAPAGMPAAVAPRGAGANDAKSSDSARAGRTGEKRSSSDDGRRSICPIRRSADLSGVRCGGDVSTGAGRLISAAFFSASDSCRFTLLGCSSEVAPRPSRSQTERLMIGVAAPSHQMIMM